MIQVKWNCVKSKFNRVVADMFSLEFVLANHQYVDNISVKGLFFYFEFLFHDPSIERIENRKDFLSSKPFESKTQLDCLRAGRVYIYPGSNLQ